MDSTKEIKTEQRKVVAVRFSATAHFDVLVNLHDKSIEKLREALEQDFSEGEVWQRLLLREAGQSSFDFVYRDEDIEIHSADILTNYPFGGKRIDIEKH